MILLAFSPKCLTPEIVYFQEIIFPAMNKMSCKIAFMTEDLSTRHGDTLNPTGRFFIYAVHWAGAI